MAAVCQSSTQAIVHLKKLTPEGVMEFTSCQAHQRTGRRLLQAGHNGKQSAVQHLVRCHLGHLWDGEFDQKMKVLWKGFVRLNCDKNEKNNERKWQRHTTTHAPAVNGVPANDEAPANNSSDSESEDKEDDDRHFFQEGKAPMTPELCKSLCRWFMAWGNIESTFATCSLVLTWRLACRSNNTGKIKTSHLQWTHFDALHIRFRHAKTQQHGEARRHKRACCSNPFMAEIDLPFTLGLCKANQQGWANC